MNGIHEEIGFFTQSEVADLLHCEVHPLKHLQGIH